MATIEIGATRAANLITGFTDFAHLYLVLTDDGGNNKSVISLPGPTLPQFRWKPLQIDAPWSEGTGEYDASRDPTKSGTVERTLDLGGRNAEHVWNVIKQVAQEFSRHDLEYGILESNSNSFVSALLYTVGIDLGDNPLPNFLPEVPLTAAKGDGFIPVPVSIGFTGPYRVDAVGHKFTGIFGTTSAEGHLRDFYYIPVKTIGGKPVPVDGPADGSFDFGFRLTGTPGNDVIRGLRGSDTFLGGAGNDTLNGGAGNDVITGGAGNDHFTASAGDDMIMDFNYQEDALWLPGGTSGMFNLRDTVLTYPGGTMTLVNVNLGPSGLNVAKDYPWLQWSMGQFVGIVGPGGTVEGGAIF